MRDPQLEAMEAELSRRQGSLAPSDSDLILMEKELARRSSQPPEEPHTFGTRIGQYFHGLAGAGEAVSDLLNKGTGQMMAEKAGVEPEELPQFQKPVSGIVTKPIEKLAGRPLTPDRDDTLGKVIHTAGELSLPFPGSGYIKAAGTGLKPLVKTLAREGAIAGSASTALHTTPSITDEGTAGRGLEDLGKMIIGGSLGKTAATKTIAKDIENLASQGRFKTPKTSLVAKIITMGAKPNAEALRIAEKHGIELPINVGMGSTPLNFINNNYLKSMFTSQVYKDVFKKADEKMIGKVKGAIDSLGSSELKPNEASAQFKNFLKEDEKIFKKEVSTLYDDASKLLKEGEVVIPSNAGKSIRNGIEILNRDIQSPGTKKVFNVLKELENAWNIAPKKEKLSAHGVPLPEKHRAQIQGKAVGLKPIEISRLDNVRKELNRLIDYDPEVKGMEAFLGRIVKDLEKDIESSPNKAFVDKRKEANKFFYNNLASRFETDLARAVMHGEAPVEAFNKMNTVENISLLEKIAGKTEKGKEVLDALKKAKLREILEKTTTSGGLEKGSLVLGQFSKLFSKGEGKQELIEKLIGKSAYNDLADVSKIAQEFSDSGKELLNTSGTAIASADIQKAEQIIKYSLSALYSGAGAGAGYAAAGLPGAVAAILMPNLLSRLLANPKFVKEARAYAIARSENKEKYAHTLLNKLIQTSRPVANQVLTEMSHKNKGEEE